VMTKVERTMRRLAVVTSVSFIAALIVLIAFGATGEGVRQPIENRVTSDLGQLDMLEAVQPMLDRMRVTVSPDVNTMLDQHPMWFDEAMIQAQEDYQAQLDRMVGRRSGRP